MSTVITSIDPRSPAEKAGVAVGEKLLQFCSVPRSRQELIDFLGFSRYYTMSKLVQPLLDAQKLALTLPEKPKSSKQRYFKP